MLVHYADLLDDLSGQMQSIAGYLGIDMPSERIDELATAAGFEAMQANAYRLAPDPAGALKDKSRFFRTGRSGAGTDARSPEDVDVYHRRAAQLAPSDLLNWLHRG